MTAKIKLNAASGGGSISIQAPSSSSNNRVIALPDIADGTLVTSQSTLDATKLSGNLPAISGANLTGISGGKILQVVQTANTTQFLSSSTSYVDFTNMSVSITPATNSKVLAIVNIECSFAFDDNEGFGMKLLRTPSGGSNTAIFTSANKYDVYGYTNFTGEHIDGQYRPCWNILDSSVGGNGSTAITYGVQVATYTSSSVAFSQGGNNSSITLFEIGA